MFYHPDPLALQVLKIIAQDPMFGKPKNMPRVHDLLYLRMKMATYTYFTVVLGFLKAVEK